MENVLAKTEHDKEHNRLYMREYLARKRLDPEWVLKERERARLKQREARLNPENVLKDRERGRRYYWANREERLAVNKAWYKEHPEYNQKKLAEYRKKGPHRQMFWAAKVRAKRAGIPFNLTIEDIVVPAVCPVLGLEIRPFAGRGFDPQSPSLDRIIPALGYVRGNVRVISYRANELKKDATPEELLAVAKWAQQETWRVERELSG